MIKTYIDGTAVIRQKGSVKIGKNIDSRSTASFTVYDETGAASYTKGTPVEIRKTFIPPFYNLLFAGFIYDVEKVRVPNTTIIYHTINCTGNAYLADKRLAGYSATADPAGTTVTALHTNYLDAEGVLINDIQAGPTIAEIIINYATISKALDKLAEYSGFIWDIDDFKQLFFGARTTTAAPFTLSETDFKRFSPRSKQTGRQYRNRQYIRAGRDTTALQTETWVGDGSTTAFTVGYPIVKVPTSIKVNAVAQTIGIKGIDTAKQSYWAKSDSVILFDPAPPNTEVVEVKYYGEYNILTVADDPALIAARKVVEGGTGIVEVLDDKPAIRDKQDAFDLAIAMIDNYGILSETFTFDIRKYGLAPGQIVTITYPEYGFTATEMLVESVKISEEAPDVPLYTVKAIIGPIQGDWTALFGALSSMKDEILERLTIGTDELLIVLVNEAEDAEITETVTQYIYACTVCNGVACGGLTPVVC